MKSDLRNLVTAQESFFSDNQDYASDIDPTTQTNGKGGAGKVAFGLSAGDVVVVKYGSAAAWSATVSNPAVKSTGCPCHNEPRLLRDRGSRHSGGRCRPVRNPGGLTVPAPPSAVGPDRSYGCTERSPGWPGPHGRRNGGPTELGLPVSIGASRAAGDPAPEW